jgi:hypothetical protein
MADDNRYQREIEEILGRVNDELPAVGGRKVRLAKPLSAPRALRSARGGGLSTVFTSGRLLLGGTILLLLALILGAQIPFWFGLAAIVLAYFVFFTKPHSPAEKRWRGESIEVPVEPNAAARFWRWVNRG